MSLKFRCGDIVKVTNSDYYIPEVQCVIKHINLIIVGIHPITINGNISYKSEDIQYICATPDYSYMALRGDTIEKVGHMDYRSIFGRFKVNQFLAMLNNPTNIVEQYHFKKCRYLCALNDRNLINATCDSEVLVKSSVSDNTYNYFTNDNITIEVI